MTGRGPRSLASAVALVAVAGLMGCTQGESANEELLDAIERSEQRARRFSYAEETAEHTVEVDGGVEDVFRYRTDASMDGRGVLQQVVQDDAIAVRLPNPDVFNPASGPPLAPLLAEGEWVQDPAGAPAVYISGSEEEQKGQGPQRQVGEDPIADALQVFSYVRDAMDAGAGVGRFDENDPTYIPSEDPFRSYIDDDQAAGIERFDIERIPLPRTQQGARQIPGPASFRKMAVYVKDGSIVRVLEVIDVRGHEEFVEAEEEGGPQFLLDLRDAVLAGRGDQEVRPRRLIARVSYEEEVDVELPSDTETANLEELVSSGTIHAFGGPVDDGDESDDAPAVPPGLLPSPDAEDGNSSPPSLAPEGTRGNGE